MTAQAASPDTSALSREEEQAEVIRRLEDDIIFGRFEPGLRLIEDTLMAPLRRQPAFCAAGPGPARAAGHRAARENIGATVRFYSADEVRHIYEVREC